MAKVRQNRLWQVAAACCDDGVSMPLTCGIGRCGQREPGMEANAIQFT